MVLSREGEALWGVGGRTGGWGSCWGGGGGGTGRGPMLPPRQDGPENRGLIRQGLGVQWGNLAKPQGSIRTARWSRWRMASRVRHTCPPGHRQGFALSELQLAQL